MKQNFETLKKEYNENIDFASIPKLDKGYINKYPFIEEYYFKK